MNPTVQRKISIVVGMDTKDVDKGTAAVMSRLQRLKAAAIAVMTTIGKISVAALAAIAVAVGYFVVQATKVAARTEVLNRVLQVVGKTSGYTAEELTGIRDRLMALGITEQDAIQMAVRFMQSNLDLADSLKIARAAQDLAALSGENSSETALTLTNAIEAQNPLLLRNFGIVRYLADIYGEYAKSVGKTIDDLTEYEKKQAFLNAILEKAKTVAGVYTEAMKDIGKVITSMPRYLQQAQNALGKHFLPVMEAVVYGLRDFLEAVERVSKLKSVSKMFKLMGESLKPLLDALTPGKEGIETYLVTVLGGVAQIIVGYIEMGKVGITAFKGVYNVAKEVFQGIVDTGETSWKALKAIVTGNVKDTKDYVEELGFIIESYMHIIGKAAGDLGEDTSEIAEKSWSKIKEVWDTYLRAIKEVREKKPEAPLPPIPEPRERPPEPIDEEKLKAQQLKLEELLYQQKLVFAKEYDRERLEVEREWVENQRELNQLTLISEGERHQASLMLLATYTEKKRKIDEKEAREKIKLTKTELKAQEIASSFLYKMEANYVGQKVALQKAAAATSIQIIGEEVKAIITAKAKEWAIKAIGAMGDLNFYSAAKYTAAVAAAGVGIALIGEATRSISERIMGMGTEVEDAAIANEGGFQQTKGIRTQGAIATRGIQNLFISPTLTFNADTLIIGDTGLETASETIKDIAVEGIKEAIETGEIALGTT